MTALGSNAHIFARPYRRQDLPRCFETALGCGPVATVDYPGIAEPMLVVRSAQQPAGASRAPPEGTSNR